MMRSYWLTGLDGENRNGRIAADTTALRQLFSEGERYLKLQRDVERDYSDFRLLPGYYNAETDDCKPVAVRYAPFRQGERFCYIISVCGKENSPGERRETHFSLYTVGLLDELLENDEGWNYLDLILGGFNAGTGRWISDVDMKYIRETQKRKREVRLLPGKITVSQLPDRVVAIHVVEALYDSKDKPVILRLEPDVSFNRRAVELLTQIYSLMEPRFAIKTGFCAYQNPETLFAAVEETNIRLFLLPYGAELTAEIATK